MKCVCGRNMTHVTMLVEIEPYEVEYWVCNSVGIFAGHPDPSAHVPAEAQTFVPNSVQVRLLS